MLDRLTASQFGPVAREALVNEFARVAEFGSTRRMVPRYPEFIEPH